MATQSLREQNKQRNFERIKQAARQLFEQKGYEATTTREIAEVAQVGTGTLFLYARDKAELLILIYSDALYEIIDRVFATLPEDLALPDKLVHVFAPFFHFYEQHMENSRCFLKELLFRSGEQRYRQQFGPLNEGFIERLAHLVRHAQMRGEIRQDVDPHQAAASFFAMYFAAVTAWLGSFLTIEADSMDQLRALFDLQIKGMLPLKEG